MIFKKNLIQHALPNLNNIFKKILSILTILTLSTLPKNAFAIIDLGVIPGGEYTKSSNIDRF